MKQPLRKLDLSQVLNASALARGYVKRCEAVVADSKRGERLAKQECRLCFYVGKIGGQAMTTCYCGICEKEMLHGNTNTPALCKECAVNHRLCKHCGGDIESKERRKI